MTYRDEVWAKIAEKYPRFTHEHDPFDDPWAVDCLVLGESIGFVPFAGANVMDLGANVGIWTAYCALGGARVTAYEADPVTFGILNGMLKKTGLRDRVSPVWAAVTYYSGTCIFKGEARPDAPDAPRLRNGAIQVVDKNFWGNTAGTVTVPCVSFDAAIGKQEFDFVKIDIEGAEFKMLINTELATLSRIKAMQIDFHGHWVDKTSYDVLLEKLGWIFNFEGPTEADPESPLFGYLHWAKFKRK